MGWSDTGFFSEKYRVVAVEAERLTIQGIITGTVLTIINSDQATPLTAEQYPLGKLIALSDPSASAQISLPLPLPPINSLLPLTRFGIWFGDLLSFLKLAQRSPDPKQDSPTSNPTSAFLATFR